MFIIVDGNPVDGFTFTGPFDHQEDAIDCANQLDSDWWIATLYKPETETTC